MLSVPVCVAALGSARLLAGGLEMIGFASLQPLLLVGLFVQCASVGPPIDPGATNAILAGVLGVSAIAVQNALGQISPKGAPSTAARTTNVTRFIYVGGVMSSAERLTSRRRATGPFARGRRSSVLPLAAGWARHSRRLSALGPLLCLQDSLSSRLRWG
jgi:hypothetical protein